MLYLLFVGNQHLPSLLDHRLRLQLLLGEAVPPRVEGLLARHAGQRQVCWVGVKVHQDITATVGARRRPRGAGGGGGRVLRHSLATWWTAGG